MGLVKCKDCHKEISTTAIKCIHCGALINRTSTATWFATVLLGLLFVVIILNKCASSESTVIQACKPINMATLLLPKDKEFAQVQFIEKAKRLNSSGLCVAEGGFGRSYDKYYIAVSKTGNISSSEILRFSYEELSK